MTQANSEYAADIAKWEGIVDHLYCDSIGLVTIGVGNLVKTEENAVGLPLRNRNTGILAVPDAKQKAFRACVEIFEKACQHGMLVGKKMTVPSAYAYRIASNLFLPDEVIFGMLDSRLKNEFIPAIVREFPAFESAPLPARKALVDIAYNCGTKGFAKFSHMLEYANAGHWQGCATSCHRKTSRDERNEWASNMFQEAARIKPWRA